MLQVFGVSQDAESVYREMLRLPEAGVAELADSLGVAPDEVRARLDELAGLSLVEPDGPHTRSGRFLALPPEVAVEVLIAREEDRIASLQRELEASREHVGDLVDAFVESRSLGADAGAVEQIDVPSVVRSRLFQLSREACATACTIIPGEAFSASATQSSQRLDLELLARGVGVRIIVSEVSTSSEHWSRYLRVVSGQGALVRVHPAPPMLLVVIDSEVSVVPNEERRGGALLLRGRSLSAPSVALFEEVWSAAAPLSGSGPGLEPDGPELSEARVRQVISLLAQGHKDEAISRRMGVSVRTVRRMVSQAVDHLQAQSRFQAGVVAAQRGLVDRVTAVRPDGG